MADVDAALLRRFERCGRRSEMQLSTRASAVCGPSCGLAILAPPPTAADAVRANPPPHRPHRRRIEVPLPDAAARADFITGVLARPEIASSLGEGELAGLVAATEGFSGSDLACLCRQAALGPVREILAACREAAPAGGGGGKRRRLALLAGDEGGGRATAAAVRPLVAADFLAALRKVRPAALDAAG
jgi:SpoVK/Ycf46/Vps4 family AAA+-type ATPase